MCYMRHPLPPTCMHAHVCNLKEKEYVFVLTVLKATAHHGGEVVGLGNTHTHTTPVRFTMEAECREAGGSSPHSNWDMKETRNKKHGRTLTHKAHPS